MFYILIVDNEDNIIAEIEEDDYESFIIICYNFREENRLANLHVFEVLDEKTTMLTSETIEEMIQTWLDTNVKAFTQ
jgi:type IV secretory pathway VirB4 component